MEKQLPKNWVECSLGDIADWSSGGTPNRGISEYYGGDIPWVKTGDLNDNIITEVKEYLTEKGIKNSSAKIFPKGSVGLAMYGAIIGKTGLFGIDAATNQACAVAVPFFEMNKFLYLFLKSEKQNFIDKGKGGAQPNISQAVIKSHSIALPPLPEQHRIVAKLNTLFTQLETIKTSMVNIPLLLKDFRQQVLTQAVTGKLTEEWRNGKELDTDFLNSIYKKHHLKIKPVKVRGQKSFENKSFFNLPNTWNWIPVYKLVKDGGNSICAGPFGTIFKAKDFRDDGIPIIFLRHVKKEGFNQRKPNYMDRKVWTKFHQEYSVYGGELLVTKLGDPPGEATIYPNNVGIAMVTPDIMKADFDEEIFKTKFAEYFFNSNIAKDIIAEVSFGMTRLRIDLTMFKSIPITVPTLKEQQEIVSRVEGLFAKADAIEQQYKTLKGSIDNLPQALLHKAFKGELTEQLESDGDARELLQQIQELKASTAKTAKTAKNSKIKKLKN